MKIDSHQHFWKYNPVKDAWITDDMKVIQRDFFPEHLQPLLSGNRIEGCVAVQADQSEAETNFLLELAEEQSAILGVVGWIDLQADNIDARLDYFSQFPKLKGFRHIVQAEPMDDFLLNERFCNGINLLKKYNFTYDVLIFPKHLPYAHAFVQKFPEQKFVLDHLAKPDFTQKNFESWEKGIRKLASLPNIYCKISGMVTEADFVKWEPQDFNYCLDVVTDAFGIDRLMFGSDWPVCLLAAEYEEVCEIVERYFGQLSPSEQAKIWGLNAAQFYRLDIPA